MYLYGGRFRSLIIWDRSSRTLRRALILSFFTPAFSSSPEKRDSHYLKIVVSGCQRPWYSRSLSRGFGRDTGLLRTCAQNVHRIARDNRLPMQPETMHWGQLDTYQLRWRHQHEIGWFKIRHYCTDNCNKKYKNCLLVTLRWNLLLYDLRWRVRHVFVCHHEVFYQRAEAKTFNTASNRRDHGLCTRTF